MPGADADADALLRSLASCASEALKGCLAANLSNSDLGPELKESLLSQCKAVVAALHGDGDAEMNDDLPEVIADDMIAFLDDFDDTDDDEDGLGYGGGGSGGGMGVSAVLNDDNDASSDEDGGEELQTVSAELTLSAIKPMRKDEVSPDLFPLEAKASPFFLGTAASSSLDCSTYFGTGQSDSPPPPPPSDLLPVTCRPVVGGLGVVDAMVMDNVLSPSECEYLCRCADGSGFTLWNEKTGSVSGSETQKAQAGRSDYRNAETVEVTHPLLASVIWERCKEYLDVLPEAPDLKGEAPKGMGIESSSGEKGVLRMSQYDYVKGDPLHEAGFEGTWDASGIGETMLFARYGAGGHFAPHTDGMTVVDFNHRSLCSVILYLNHCDAGGETRVIRGDQSSALTSTTNDGGGGSSSSVVYTCKPECVLDSVRPVPGRMLVFYHDVLHEGCPVNPPSPPDMIHHCKYIIRTDIMYKRREPMLTAPKDVEAFKMFERARDLEADGAVMEAMELLKKCCRLSPGLADVYGM